MMSGSQVINLASKKSNKSKSPSTSNNSKGHGILSKSWTEENEDKEFLKLNYVRQ